MANQVSFYLNGKEVSIQDPSPDLLLIDYLRSPEVALAGPKKPCGQGGCGGCTVILSNWNPVEKEIEHRAINSCLRAVCALGGLVFLRALPKLAVEMRPVYRRLGILPDE